MLRVSKGLAKIMMMMMTIMMMIMIIIAVTQSILKLGSPDFAWK